MSKRALRLFHTNVAQKQMLVGPPHPVSNLRPILYSGVPDQSKTNAYSPNELHSDLPVDPVKFQLNNTLRSLDKLNHEFWTESNQRFHTAREAFLNTRKAELDGARTPEERAVMEERHMSEFYASWVTAMRPMQHEYTRAWLRGQYGGIVTAARMTWRGWMHKVNAAVGNRE